MKSKEKKGKEKSKLQAIKHTGRNVANTLGSCFLEVIFFFLFKCCLSTSLICRWSPEIDHVVLGVCIICCPQGFPCWWLCITLLLDLKPARSSVLLEQTRSCPRSSSLFSDADFTRLVSNNWWDNSFENRTCRETCCWKRVCGFYPLFRKGSSFCVRFDLYSSIHHTVACTKVSIDCSTWKGTTSLGE